MNLKQQLDNDIKRVFQNKKEFAEVKKIVYEGKILKVSAITDYSELTERKKAGSDNAEGLFSNDLLLFVSLEEFGKVPRRGQEIELDGEIYEITRVKEEAGELTIYLNNILE